MTSHYISSFLHFPISKRLVWLSLLVLVVILLNPLASIDIAVLVLFLLILGHILLREKLLLVFLLLRPALDYWRDLPVLTYRDTTLHATDAIAILFLFWAGGMIFSYRREIRHIPLRLTILSLSAFMTISIFWSVVPFTTLIETIKFLNLALFFWLSYCFVKHKRLTPRAVALAIVGSSIVPILFAFGQLFTNTGVATFDIRGRIYGTFGHPNVFAFLMLSLIILHTQYSTIAPTDFWKKNHSLQLTAYSLLAALMLLTYTRVTLIGLLIFLLIIGITKYRALFAGLVVGISMFYLIFFPLNDWLIKHANYSLTSIPVIGRLTVRNDEADSIGWRLSLVRETIPIIASRPLLGYGFGSFSQVWSDNRSLAHQFDDSAEAHNDYLRLALELGLIGLALYIGLIGRIGQIAAKQLAQNKIGALHLFAWVMVFAAVSLSDNMLHHTPIMWLTFAYWGATLATPSTPGSLLQES